jgi:hypothetical protein
MIGKEHGMSNSVSSSLVLFNCGPSGANAPLLVDLGRTILRRPCDRDDEVRHTSAISLHVLREFLLNDCHPKHQRAQGMPGARCARSLACKIKKAYEIVTTVTPDTPGIPRAMVLTVSSELSPVIGLCCHRRQRKNFRRLDASVEASGPHDFAVRESAVRQQQSHRPPHLVPRS